MLIDDRTGHIFKPTLYNFAGQFSCYDEDHIEEYLNKFDPNNTEDRKLLARYVINELSFLRKRLSYKHIWLLTQTLENALKDKEHDFNIYFNDDDDNYYYMPGDWDEIQNPRSFFEEILKVAKEEWKEDLEKASKEDPSTW